MLLPPFPQDSEIAVHTAPALGLNTNQNKTNSGQELTTHSGDRLRMRSPGLAPVGTQAPGLTSECLCVYLLGRYREGKEIFPSSDSFLPCVHREAWPGKAGSPGHPQGLPTGSQDTRHLLPPGSIPGNAVWML